MKNKSELVVGIVFVLGILLFIFVPTAYAILIMLSIIGVLVLLTFVLNPSKSGGQTKTHWSELKKEKHGQYAISSSDINNRTVEKPKTRPRKDPVIVRGKYWVNTEEDRWEIPDLTSINNSNLDDLIQQLNNIERAEFRSSAAKDLEQLGQEATPAIPNLIISSLDPNEDVRKASLNALNAIDPNWPTYDGVQSSIPYLVSTLINHPSNDVLKSAIEILQIVGSPTIFYLSDRLINGEDTVNNIHIIRLLSQIDSSDEIVIQGITRALGSQHLHVRITAANALAEIGPTEDTIPALVTGLSDSFSNVRIAMTSCLGQLGEKAEPAIPSLIPLLIDRNNDVRNAAAKTMVQIGAKAVPALIEIVNTHVVERLKAWFQAKNEILRQIQEPQHDMIITDHYKAFASLTWTALDILEERDCRELAQEAALRVLGQIGPEAVDAVTAVVNALQDANPRIRAAAAKALGQIGPFDESNLENSISGLINTLVDRNKTVRETSIEAISKFKTDQIAGELVIDSIKRISMHLESPREFAVYAFVSIGAPSIPILTEILETGNRVARQNAAKAIGLIGPGAESAIPMLTQALQSDNHPWVQEEIAKTIAKIQGEIA